MKISNSKKELARIISENGGWRDEAKWSVQHKTDGRVVFTKSKYKPEFNDGFWDVFGTFYGGFVTHKALPNWHQCILSREEYFHLYPATDADGWIEWKGGECPVDRDALVVCKVRSGKEWRNGKAIMAGILRWYHSGSMTDIIAYSPHKPEQQLGELCYKVTEENKHEHVDAKPTIEQLAADYCNRKDYADRKQEEADAAKADADDALRKLELAGEDNGLIVTPVRVDKEHKLVITDYRHLHIGDILRCKCAPYGAKCNIGDEGFIKRTENHPLNGGVYVEIHGRDWFGVFDEHWEFIRRP